MRAGQMCVVMLWTQWVEVQQLQQNPGKGMRMCGKGTYWRWWPQCWWLPYRKTCSTGPSCWSSFCGTLRSSKPLGKGKYKAKWVISWSMFHKLLPRNFRHQSRWTSNGCNLHQQWVHVHLLVLFPTFHGSRIFLVKFQNHFLPLFLFDFNEVYN